MPIPDLRIRRATADDAAAIGRVQYDTWRSSYRGLVPDALLDGLDPLRWERLAARSLVAVDPARIAHVAELDGEIVGHVSAGRERSGTLPAYPGEIYAIYVRDAHQGQHIGRRLMRAAAADLVARALTPIMLWTLFDNPRSRGFYESLGGLVIGEKRETFEGHELHEVGYGWRDPAPLLAAR
jgi:GNAT superfamily N-acetyltransferase